MLKQWESLPDSMQLPEIKEYYDILKRKTVSLVLKKIFDIMLAMVLFVFLLIPMIMIAIAIKLDSCGPIFYRQERVTTYGRIFRIHKFRTMVDHADENGMLLTVQDDKRVTRVGAIIRKYRLDEFPQILDVLTGNMSFVGTRPEIAKYVQMYTPEMRATLLLPAGITSEASIRYKDENILLNKNEDADEIYATKILQGKMQWNLKSIREFTLLGDFMTMIRTILAVFGKEYN